MAEVKRFVTDLGVTVIIDDACCANLTEEQIAERWRRVDDAILRIDEKVQRKRLREQQARAAD